MSRYRYRFGPYFTDRYRFQANVTQSCTNVTDRYRSLSNFTVNCVTSVTDSKRPLKQIFKDLFKKLM